MSHDLRKNKCSQPWTCIKLGLCIQTEYSTPSSSSSGCHLHQHIIEYWLYIFGLCKSPIIIQLGTVEETPSKSKQTAVNSEEGQLGTTLGLWKIRDWVKVRPQPLLLQNSDCFECFKNSDYVLVKP